MDVFDLIHATKAEVVASRAVAVVDGKRVIVARLVDNALVLTKEGEDLALAVTAKPKKRASRKRSAPDAVPSEVAEDVDG